MRIAFSIFFMFAFSGCVTFNSIDFKKEAAKNQNLCVNLEFKVLKRGLTQNGNKVIDLEKVRTDKVIRTIKNLSLDAACAGSNAKKLVVLINDKTSIAMPIFAGVTSIFTVLSLGIIPTYYSGNMELILMDGDKHLLSREFAFSTMMWLPFVFKQWQDDKKAFDLYDVDARSAILGLEIGKLLVEYSAIESKKSD